MIAESIEARALARLNGGAAQRLRDRMERRDGTAPTPLPPELLPVEPFPINALPDAFRPWVSDVVERMHCAPDFVAVPMLIAASSLVARRVQIRPQRVTPWTERGNLWALIVARPGWMKSPAMQEALAPMERLEARAAERFNAATAEHRVGAMASKLRSEAAQTAARKLLKGNAQADVTALLVDGDETDSPVRPRYLVNDLTYEKLGEVLHENPDGVLSVRDEMRGLLVHLAREENASARAFYLQAWSGGRYTFDRIGRGTVTVEDARLSIIGAIQPAPLCELMRQARRNGGSDGMIERFLIAWPDPVGPWREADRPLQESAKRGAWRVFDRLDTLRSDELHALRDIAFDGNPEGGPFLRFDDEAREAFVEWRSDLEARIVGAEGEGIEAALSKFRTHIPALALCLHVIDGGIGPVGLAPTVRGLALAEYFESHARRLHSSGRRIQIQAASALLTKVRSGALPDPFTARDVYRKDWSGLNDRASVAEALDLLTAHGWVHEHEMPVGTAGGRPTMIYSLSEGARRG